MTRPTFTLEAAASTKSATSAAALAAPAYGGANPPFVCNSSGNASRTLLKAAISGAGTGTVAQWNSHIRAVFVVLGAMTQMEMAALMVAYRKVWWF